MDSNAEGDYSSQYSDTFSVFPFLIVLIFIEQQIGIK